ncbi:MAG: nucleoside deaminase [Phycisphaerales bacterium]|nr:nucleoside deaminase [Phycisphaerales bacterium]
MMTHALTLAQEAADRGEVPVGAVVYETQTGKILGEGSNTRECDKNPSGHAEFTAILNACKNINDWRLNHCTLIVTLEPCPMCSGLIVNARLGRVVYGASDPKAGAVRSLYQICDDSRLNHRSAIIPGVMAPESSQLLKSFFKQLRAPQSKEN